ncbi:MAG: penicillin-binding protein activator [Alphaproteobacteria bacterium]|nr:penicillin-binding protein activator [Alphaproteobacteria bacterium]
MHKSNFKNIFFLICFVIISAFSLSGCTGGGYNAQPWQNNPDDIKPAQDNPGDLRVPGVESQALGEPLSAQDTNGATPIVRVGILLPLSGQHAGLGQSMLQAAHMALMDMGHGNFELMPRDTAGTSEGARKAAREALNDGAQLILGPVFSDSVRAVRPIAQSADVNVIAFSTDWHLANRNTYLIGFLPFDQVERVIRFASMQGLSRIGVISPEDSYGNGVVSAFQAITENYPASSVRVERFSTKSSSLGPVMARFTDYQQRKSTDNAYGMPFDAVLMPVGGALARQVGSFLNHYDMPPSAVRRLGTGLMDDPSLAKDKSLDGMWFAAPDPQARKKFEQHYKSLYYTEPERIASLAYDATALAAVLARSGIKQKGYPAFDAASITNPNGFYGVDGIFRFRSDGIVQRGLAMLEFRNGKIVVIDRAPKSFQNNQF